MTTPTLKELARKHLWKHAEGNNFHGNLDQLRALITEAVGIVQGDVVARAMFDSKDSENKCAFLEDDPDLNTARMHKSAVEIQLHHNDMERLK